MSQIEAYLTWLAGNKNARNNFLRNMGPYAQMSERDMLTNIRSMCNQIPLGARKNYLNSIHNLSRNKLCQTKKMKRRINHLSNIFSTVPVNRQFLGYGFRRGWSGYGPGPGYGYPGFFGGGLLGSLILLFLLGAIF